MPQFSTKAPGKAREAISGSRRAETTMNISCSPAQCILHQRMLGKSKLELKLSEVINIMLLVKMRAFRQSAVCRRLSAGWSCFPWEEVIVAPLWFTCWCSRDQSPPPSPNSSIVLVPASLQGLIVHKHGSYCQCSHVDRCKDICSSWGLRKAGKFS